MLKDKIIEKVLNDISLDPRISDGIFDIKNCNHIGYLCEYLIGKGIESEIVYEFCDLLLEKGKFPERQAYNRDGILVTFPTPEYKKEAIRAGTHFEHDPTKGRSNLFQSPPAAPGPEPATSPEEGRPKSNDKPVKTNLPISTSTATPPPSEKSGEDVSEPSQPMPNVFTTSAPQQSPSEMPEKEPTKLPEPQPYPPKEKEANKELIKKILKGDDYMLEEMITWFMYNAPEYLTERINKKLKEL